MDAGLGGLGYGLYMLLFAMDGHTHTNGQGRTPHGPGGQFPPQKREEKTCRPRLQEKLSEIQSEIKSVLYIYLKREQRKKYSG